MTNRLEISVLGGLQLHLGETSPTLPPGKSEALLIYLVCTGQPQPRELLAELLWQADSHKQARRNLTYALYRLRQALDSYIITTQQTIAFDQTAEYWLDIAVLEQQVATATEEATLSKAQATALAEALGLYQGDFLAGFYLTDAPDFEAWVTDQRERAHRQAIEGMHRLISHYAESSDYTNGLEWAQRLIALDEFDEVAHRQMMRLLALSGQRGAALSQFDAYQQALQAEFGVDPLEETRALYEQIQAGDLSQIEPPPPRIPLPDIPFQAPVPPSHFVGREVETAQLQLGLSQAAHPRIQALVGMGGVGKTTLAAYMAHHLRETFPDGVLWGNVATSAPMDILATWAGAYNHDFSGLSDLESRAAAVRNLLADKQTLLIIDNVIGSKDIQALLPSGQQCATLLTTRDLDAAHALKAETLLLGELSVENARQLLVYILGEARVAAEEAAALEICELLQNLPLAVEIAAQRLKSRARQKLAQMATRLREMKNRVGLQVSDQAVRASFEVSWEALDEELQAIFPLLAVFEGRPFAAEAIAYLADTDVFDVEDHLYALAALSLVKEEGDAHFRQHPLLADFALEKLVDRETVYSRMSDYYLIFAQENSGDQTQLRPELKNLLRAIQVAYEQKRWQLVLDFTDRLYEPWLILSRYNNIRQASEWATEAATILANDLQVGTNLLRWGKACLEQAGHQEARQHLAKSLTYYERLDHKAGMAETRYLLGRIFVELNEHNQAEKELVESLSLWASLGEIDRVGQVLFQQAVLAYGYGDYKKARDVAVQALDLQEQTAQPNDLAELLRALAHIMLRLEAPQEAQIYGERAKSISEHHQLEDQLGWSLYTLTCVYNIQGEFELARSYANQSLPMQRRQGIRRIEGMLLRQLGLTHVGLGDYDIALTSTAQSLEIFRAMEDRLGCADALYDLGNIYQKLNETPQAKTAWQEAYQIAEYLEHTPLMDKLQQNLDQLQYH
ncbi:MAG: tetratricopeptide repeat protein [Chloroflexota bacterium]